MLSARLSQVDAPQLDGLDAVLVVFDVEVDAASLDARGFVVSVGSSGPVRPRRAILAPASEDDENRSVLLIGELGDATASGQPTHVAVRGPVYAEDGRGLSGLGATVEAFETAPRVVMAVSMRSSPTRCAGADTVVRTYWSDRLRGVGPDDRDRVWVGLGGASVHPVAFDDHATEHGESAQDNVLDLCLPASASAGRLRIEPGAFEDVAGHPSAAIDVQVAVSTGGP